jgi:hypothetical protein
MLHGIATERDIRMPSVFGYLIWSTLVLAPIFALITYVFVGQP